MPDVIRHVFERYPEASREIRTLAMRDPEFRATCEDFGKCLEALDHWGRERDSASMARAEEYRDLCKKIETEIFERLQT